MDGIIKHIKTIDITECENFGSEILHVIGSALDFFVRSKTKHVRVNTKNYIETSRRIQKNQGLGKCHDTIIKIN